MDVVIMFVIGVLMGFILGLIVAALAIVCKHGDDIL